VVIKGHQVYKREVQGSKERCEEKVYPEMWKKISSVSVLFIVLSTSLLLAVPGSSASVNYFEIRPEKPVQGEPVTLKGTASPSELVTVTISFEKNLTVADGRYEWRLSSVEIPEGENLFTVTATNVNKLRVALKFLGIWITRSTDAENGTAKITQTNVPAGTYDVLIYGDSNSTKLSIRVEAETFLTADSTGNFNYEYDTSPIPAGEFVVTVGNVTETVELLGDGGSGSVTPSTPTGTPIITSPTPQPTPIITPGITPQNKTTKPSRIPGFESIGGIVALIIILIMLSRLGYGKK
jgi:hypothetical protein